MESFRSGCQLRASYTSPVATETCLIKVILSEIIVLPRLSVGKHELVQLPLSEAANWIDSLLVFVNFNTQKQCFKFKQPAFC